MAAKSYTKYWVTCRTHGGKMGQLSIVIINGVVSGTKMSSNDDDVVCMWGRWYYKFLAEPH